VRVLQLLSTTAVTHLASSRVLLELNTGDETLWTYFDSQHKYIVNQMNTVYKNAVASVKVNLERTSDTGDLETLNMTLATQLQSCVAAMEAKQSETYYGKPQDLSR
jgi:exocyst complex component 2